MVFTWNYFSVVVLFSLFSKIKSDCEPQNCIPGQWTPWTSCSVTCNKTPGTRHRERDIMMVESCGGTCDVDLSQTEPCTTDVCCPEDCQLSTWSGWRHCICTNTTSFCDLKGQEVWVCSRSRILIQKEQCGGWCDHKYSETKCGNLCCRKNCILGTWTWWGPCIGQCEQEGVQFRNLRVEREEECGGNSCESMQRNESRSCMGGCCPVNCVLGEWSEWGGCNATCGKGSNKRTRFVQKAECNGIECTESPDENQYKDCTKYINVDCVVSPWSLWTSCLLENGKCGVGHKNRTRTVTVPSECVGKPCPNVTETAVCYGECCRQDCQVSQWTVWGPCSSDCGAGISSRKREVEIAESCSGTVCPTLLETKECNISSVVNCQMSEWEEWTACSNNCGTGSAYRSRKLLTPAYCGGQQCANMTLQDVKSCESYEANVDCVVNEWETWGDCFRNCDQGMQNRKRTIKTNPICKGQSCPLLSMDDWQDWEECRRNCDKGIQLRHRKIKNNQQCKGKGCSSKLEFRYCHEKCQHNICNARTFECGCNTGYKLSTDGYSCHPILCPPVPQLKYCPANRILLKNCRYPSFAICSNSYNVNCTISCQTNWNLIGPQDYVTCQDDAMWSKPESFCSPKNNAPTDIQIDLSKTSIPENTAAGYCIYMSTVDDSYDSHVYTIVKDVSQRFEVIEHRLCLKVIADYEDPPNIWNLTIRSTDLDNLSVDKTFEFKILNSNDPPTAVYLTPNFVPENSMNNVKVGCFTGKDDDPNQTLTFLLVNSNKQMFATFTENGQTCLKVAMDSDEKCPTEGGTYCLLNREIHKRRTITIMATDDGSPRGKAYFDIHIALSDVNDKPTAVGLEFPDVPEGVQPGGDLVAMTTEDEDVGQSYTYTLVADPSGLFTIVDGKLRASRSFDYETEKLTEFTIDVTSTDNGGLSVTSTINFKIKDMNEAPYDLQLNSDYSQFYFENNKPKVRENAQAVAIGTVTVKDYDEGDELTLTLLENADGRLNLKPPRCSSVADVNVYCTSILFAYASFNHETEPTISFSIQAEDKDGLVAVVNLTMEVLDVNDEASDILIDKESMSKVFVEENKLDDVIGHLSAIDEDLTDLHTYSITDPSGLFVVEGNILKTSATVTIDYEINEIYTIKLTAEDNGNPPMSHDKTIIINIVNVNEAPSDIQITNNLVAENSDVGLVIGELSTEDPDNSVNITQTFTYELVDDGSDRFEIQGNKLQVKKSKEVCNNKPCSLDYEQEKVVNVKVKVTDNGTQPLTFEKTIAILLTDVNDPPVVNIAGNSIAENLPVDTEVGVLTVRDDDSGQTVTVQLIDTADIFYLKDGTTLVSKQSLNYEDQAKYNITVRATDDGTPSSHSDTVISVEVLNINEEPSFTGETTLSVEESSPLETVVGSVIIVDPDKDDILTLTLAGVSQEFTLTSDGCKQEFSGTKCTGTLSTKLKLKYTDRQVYTVTVTAQDQQGSTVVQLYTINIMDKNDPPQDILFDDIVATSLNIIENTAGIDVTELSALDPDDGQTHTFTLTDDGSLFELQGNILRIKSDAMIDFEAQKEYSISIEVKDSGTPPLTFTKQATVVVEDINEEPTKLTLDNNKVGENSDKDTVIGSLLVDDPDNHVEVTQTFSFVMISSAGGRFKVEDGQIKVAQSNTECLSMGNNMCKLNYEDTKKFEIKVLVSDNGVPAQSQTFSLSVEISDENDPPRNLQLSAYKVQENAPSGTTIGDLTFVDEDIDQTHIISLVDDNEGRFSVSSSGVVTKATDESLDTSKVYVIEAKVTDNGNPQQSIQQKLSITVIGDIVITLTFTSDGGSTTFENNNPSVEENSIADTIIGTLKAEYEDTSQDMVFDIKESNGLEIVKLSAVFCNTENQMRVCTTKVLVADKMNFEVQSQYTLTSHVITEDAGKKTVETCTLTVLDVNEAPTKIHYSGGEPSVQENVNGITLGVFTVDDIDHHDSHTYLLTNDGAGQFILSQTGHLSVSEDAELDYESQDSVDLEVKVTDHGGLTIRQQFTVQITDVNEIPTKVELNNNQVLEMSAVGTLVGDLVTDDPDKDQTFTYTLTDNAGGRFVLDGNQVKVKAVGQDCETLGNDKCLLDFESATSHTIVVMVTDNGKPPMSNSFTLTVVVEDVNDPPSNLAIKVDNLREDLPLDSKVAMMEVDDEDDSSFIYSITAGDEGVFTVIGNTIGLLQTLDYETKPTYNITVEATDSRDEPQKISKMFVLQVINVNEPPFSLSVEPISGQTNSFQTNKPIIDENMPVDTMIGRVTILDHDATDSVTFTTTSTKIKLYNQKCIRLTHATRCTADVRSSVSFDFESEASVDLLFYAADKEGLKISKRITLTIGDANDPPTDIKVEGSLTIPENTVDFVMATLSADDTDTTQTHSFTIRSDTKFFYIAHNQLKVTSAAELDFEKQKTHEITIRASDNGNPSLHFDKVFTVDVTDVNEAPYLVKLTGNKIPENSESDYVIGSLITEDPDNQGRQTQSFTYTMTDNANGRFQIYNKLVIVDQPDFDYETERSYAISVLATDTGQPSLSKEVTFTIEITDSNDPPSSITLSAQSVAENSVLGTVVGSVSAVDLDAGQTLSFSVSKGGYFSISGDSVVVSGSIDFEMTPTVIFEVQALDNGFPPLSTTKNFTIEVTDQNEKPAEVKILNSEKVIGRQIPENLLIDEVIGTLVAFDPDDADKMTFSLSETGSSVFKLSSASPNCEKSVVDPYLTECSLDVLLDKIVNYEDPTQRSHKLVVIVTDHLGLKYQQEFVFGVINTNEPPYDIIIGGEITSIPENTPNYEIGKLESLDDDVDDLHIYQVITHWELFAVKAGILIAIQPVDYEQKQSYSVTIKSKDNGNPSESFTKTFVFSVDDENEAPSDINVSPSEVSNAADAGDVVGIVTVIDPDNSGTTQRQTHTCTVGGEGVGMFTVDNSNMQLKVSGAIPLEKNQTTIDIHCTDSGQPPLSTTVSLIIDIKETIQVPKIIVLKDQKVVVENVKSFTVGKLEVVNQLSGDTITGSFLYLLSDLSMPFKINGGMLQINGPLNYEFNSEWTVTVTASGMDSGNIMELEATFKVEVSNVNEAPYKITVIEGGYILENSDTGATIGDLSTEDHEMDQTYTYTLLDIAKGLDIKNADDQLKDVFIVDGETLKIGTGTEHLNFEETKVFTILVNSKDSGIPLMDVNDTINIVIQDVNDPPSDITFSKYTIAENSVISTVVCDVIVTDEDKDQKHSCDLDNSRVVPFDITDDLTLVVSKDELDYEGTRTYVLEVSCRDKGDDGTQFTYKKALVVKVTDANEAPYDITMTSLEISESSQPGESVGGVQATDPDSTVVTFTVEGSSLFKIEGEDTLVTTSQLDYEDKSTYTITIRATDDGGLSSTKDFVLKVTDENEAPTVIHLDNTEVEENIKKGHLIGTFSTEDPDRGQSFTYALVPGESDGYFAITDNQLIAGHLTLDYETTNEYKVLVKSTDNGQPPKSVQAEFTITIKDVNESPETIIFESISPMPENTPSNTIITTVQVDDQDVGQSHSCSLQNKSTPFAILTNENGGMTLVLNRLLDFETAEKYDLMVQCSDGEFETKKVISVTVVDLNEPPTSITLSGSKTVLADGKPGDVISQISADDPDHNQVLSFVLKGPNSDIFRVEGNKLILNSRIPSEILTSENPVIKITIQASDNGDPIKFTQQNFTLLITNIEIVAKKLPVVAIDHTELPEDSEIGTVIGTLYNINESIGEDIVFELETNPDDLFSIKDNKQLVLAKSLAEYVGTSVTVVIKVKNTESFETASQPVTILVKHVDRCLRNGKTCSDDARCVKLNQTYHDCHCEPGFTGDGYSCSNIDDCIGEDTCQNGATCIDSIEMFSCICPKDFDGERCEISLQPNNPCKTNPCKNNAGCVSEDGKSYVCECSPGWTGATCSKSVDDCADSTCLAGGQCKDRHRTYICECPAERLGPRCQYIATACKADDCHNGTSDMCIPLYNSQKHACAESIKDLVKLVDMPSTENFDKAENTARISDVILALIRRTGTPDNAVQVYIDSVSDNGDGTANADVIVLNAEDIPFTTDEVIDMLYTSCTELENEGLAETDVCPAVQSLHSQRTVPVDEPGLSMAVIGGAAGGGVVLIIIIITAVIIKKKMKDKGNGNGYKEL